MMSARGDVIHPRRRIPGEEEIPFDVAVVCKHVAGGVEVEIVGLRKPWAMTLALFEQSGGRRSKAPASESRIGEFGRVACMLPIDFAVIAADDVPPAIRSLAHRMAAVFGVRQGDECSGGLARLCRLGSR